MSDDGNLSFRELLIQRLTALEVEMKNMNSNLEAVKQHSNHDITELNLRICKQQEQIDECLTLFSKFKTKQTATNIKSSLIDKVEIYIGAALLVGGITIGFDLLAEYIKGLMVLLI